MKQAGFLLCISFYNAYFIEECHYDGISGIIMPQCNMEYHNMQKYRIFIAFSVFCCIMLLCAAYTVLADEQEGIYLYDSLETAATDLANDTVGELSTLKGPVAVNSHTKMITLLNDVTLSQTCAFSHMTLNLGGYTVKMTPDSGIILSDAHLVGGNVILPATTEEDDVYQAVVLSHSTAENINFSSQSGYKVYCLYADSEATVKNCTFDISGDYYNVRCVTGSEDAVMYVENCSFHCNASCHILLGVHASGTRCFVRECMFDITNTQDTGDASYVYGVYSSTGLMQAENCDFSIRHTGLTGRCYGITCKPDTTIEVNGCSVYADSHYLSDNTTYVALAIGIIGRECDMRVLDTSVHGNHSGMQISGKLYACNSSFEATGHGGIYFCKNRVDDIDGPLPTIGYVKNCSLSHCPAQGIFEVDASSKQYSGDNKAAFYIGGSSGATNIHVVMDRCTITGEKYSGVLRGSSQEHDNSLHISNSTVTAPMRVDNNTHCLYVGENVNIVSSDIFYWNRKCFAAYDATPDAQVFFETLTYGSPFHGDYTDDGLITDEDAVYLLYFTLFPESYPVLQSPDYNNDGIVEARDAADLLNYTLGIDMT